MNIKDYPELLEASDSDWLLIQENATIPAYKKIKLINLQGDNTSSQSSANWIYKNGNVDFTINTTSKIVINTPRDLTIHLNSLADGSEIEIKRLNQDNSLFITGISRIQSIEVEPLDLIEIPFSDTSTRLIYVNSFIGWIIIPELSVVAESSLDLPSEGLTQVFNAETFNTTGKVLQWEDEINGSLAIQNNFDKQAEYVESIFGEETIGGLLFTGSEEYELDLSYLIGQKYTIAIVEARTDEGRLYLFGSRGAGTNSGLHVGFRNSTTFRLGQFYNDLDASIPGYTELEPTLWVVSNNSRGKEIFKNGILIASRNDTRDLVNIEDGKIGSGIGAFYKGYLGLIAVWVGDKSLVQIEEINLSVNSTFKVY